MQGSTCMEMHQVRYYVAVAKYLSFTRAAEAMRVAQPSLTRAIQKLESELGGPLFRRERSNTHLTELGRLMLPHLQAALTAAEAAKAQARRLKKQDIGSLALGICVGIDASPPAALLLETVRKLNSIELSVEVAATEAVEQRLLAGEFDAAVLAPLNDTNERFDLNLIHRDELVVAFADGHRFAKQQSLTLDALDAEPLVVRFGCRFEEAIAGHMSSRGLARYVRHRCNEPRWIAELVRNGLGCSVVPTAVARAYDLPHCRLEGIPLQHRTVLATVAGRRHSHAVTTLIHQIGARSRA